MTKIKCEITYCEYNDNHTSEGYFGYCTRKEISLEVCSNDTLACDNYTMREE